MRTIIGQEGRVLAVVILGLLAGEAAVRCGENWLSLDIRHLREFGTRAAIFQEDHSPKACRVLCLGNSMTRYGIDSPEFEEIGSTLAHRPIETVKIHPDGTQLADWYYLYRNYFHETGRHPDVLLVPFKGDQLADRPCDHLNRLARFYQCSGDDLTPLTQWDLSSLDEAAHFLLSKTSVLFCHHDRFDRRLFDQLIPGYQSAVHRINEQLAARSASHSSAPMSKPAARYERLADFLKMASADGVPVFFVAMPIVADYPLDPEALQLIRRTGAELIDCRQIPELVKQEMIPDTIHLNESGAAVFSRYLASALPWGQIFRSAPANVATRDGIAGR